jgi:hypothetical protein
MKKKKETQDKIVSILEQYVIKAYADDKTIDVPYVVDADPKEFITNKPLGEDTEIEEDFLIDDPEEFGYEEGELDGKVGNEKEPDYEEGELDGNIEDEDEPENYKEVDDEDDEDEDLDDEYDEEEEDEDEDDEDEDLDDEYDEEEEDEDEDEDDEYDEEEEDEDEDEDDEYDEDLNESIIIEQKKIDDEDEELDLDAEEKNISKTPETPEDLSNITAEEPTGKGEKTPGDSTVVPGAEGSPENLAAGGDDVGGTPMAWGMDPSMAGMTDPSMGANIPGMGMDRDEMGLSHPPTAEQIGRIFELKKIYSRLLSIEQYLAFSSDEFLLNLKLYISKAIELFETLIFNLDSFKNRLDDIIVLYYTFVQSVYDLLEKYYKKKDKEDSEDK